MKYYYSYYVIICILRIINSKQHKKNINNNNNNNLHFFFSILCLSAPRCYYHYYYYFLLSLLLFISPANHRPLNESPAPQTRRPIDYCHENKIESRKRSKHKEKCQKQEKMRNVENKITSNVHPRLLPPNNFSRFRSWGGRSGFSISA